MNQEREIGARFKHIHDKFTQHMNQKLRCLNVLIPRWNCFYIWQNIRTGR